MIDYWNIGMLEVRKQNFGISIPPAAITKMPGNLSILTVSKKAFPLALEIFHIMKKLPTAFANYFCLLPTKKLSAFVSLWFRIFLLMDQRHQQSNRNR